MAENGVGEARSWERVKRDGYLSIATLYTNLINQRAALVVTLLAWRLGLTPNVLTVTSALLTGAAGAILVLCRPLGLVEVGIAYGLLSFGYILDSSDGQLARVARLGSSFGAWLDHFVDGVKIVFLNLCFGWCLTENWHGTDRLSLAYLAMALNVLSQSALFFGSKLKIARYGANLSRKLGMPSRRVRLLSLPFELMDWGLFILFVFLLPWPRYFLPLYLIYGSGCVVAALGYFAISAAQMRRSDRAEPADTPPPPG